MLSALRCECVVAVSYCSTLYNYLTTLFLFKANEHVGCSLATYLFLYMELSFLCMFCTDHPV